MAYSLAVLGYVIILNVYPFFLDFSSPRPKPHVCLLWKFTLEQLGHVLFFVARSTCATNEKIASLPKKFNGNDGKDIHAIAMDISSSGSNKDLTSMSAWNMTNSYD